MEVHTHSHTPRKKWTHYLWEFLMLFLAVFCGFLAENFREHQVEKNKGTQYMLSLYQDLKTDTAKLNEILLYDADKIAGLDDIEACYDSIAVNPLSTECMAKVIIYTRGNRSFVITDRTITQLANAGGFRLMKKEDADSVLGYLNMFKDYQDFQGTIFQSSQDNVRNTLNELANFKSISSLSRTLAYSHGTTTSAITPDMSAHGPLLFSNDKFLINKWFNQLSVYMRITKGQRRQLSDLKEKAAGIIAYFKKKYHLN